MALFFPDREKEEPGGAREQPHCLLLYQCPTVLGTEGLVSPIKQIVLSYRLMMSPDWGFILSPHPLSLVNSQLCF